MSERKSFANFAASSFLCSKRSLKKIYGLTVYERLVLRYICDCIDLSYSRNKKLEAKIYQSQIAMYCGIHRTKANEVIRHLIIKKLIDSVGAKRTFKNHRCVVVGYTSTLTLGKILKCSHRLHGIDVSPMATRPRCVATGDISKASNISKGKSDVSHLKSKKQNQQPEKSESVEERLERLKRKMNIL